ncbi:MAG: hypothetical protein CMH54_09535 [Myxococcales bacterium]|nr:hypothetical protein [Myxococcales bacterium]
MNKIGNRFWLIALGLMVLVHCGSGSSGPADDVVVPIDVPSNLDGGDTGPVSDLAADVDEDAAETSVSEDVPTTDMEVVPTDAEDAGPGDTSDDTSEDTSSVVLDEGQPDLGQEEELPPPQSVLSVTITAPESDLIFELGTEVEFKASVADSQYSGSDLEVIWTSSKDGVLAVNTPDEEGNVSFTSSTLSAGAHAISVKLMNPLDQEAIDAIDLDVCSWQQPTESFDTNIDGSQWQIYGDAYWDAGGWLEMTGLVQGQKGAIYNTVDIVQPGDVHISFRIYTGCPNSAPFCGADGFAMSIWEAQNVAQLEDLIDDGNTGGGLGYGVAGNYGSVVVNAFHIEFDTWHNEYNGTTQLHTDPTPENHVGVMLNGDPGTHHLWAEIPTIEDQQWHDVIVDVNGTNVVVKLDGVSIIDGNIPGLDFRGGYIGFSGTTGYYYNYHRFDDLSFLEVCLVP